MYIKLNWKDAELQITSTDLENIINAIEITEKWYSENLENFPPDNMNEIYAYSSSLKFWKTQTKVEKIEATVQDISCAILSIQNEVGWATQSWTDSGPHGIDFERVKVLSELKCKLSNFLIWYYNIFTKT